MAQGLATIVTRTCWCRMRWSGGDLAVAQWYGGNGDLVWLVGRGRARDCSPRCCGCGNRARVLRFRAVAVPGRGAPRWPPFLADPGERAQPALLLPAVDRARGAAWPAAGASSRCLTLLGPAGAVRGDAHHRSAPPTANRAAMHQGRAARSWRRAHASPLFVAGLPHSERHGLGRATALRRRPPARAAARARQHRDSTRCARWRRCPAWSGWHAAWATCRSGIAGRDRRGSSPTPARWAGSTAKRRRAFTGARDHGRRLGRWRGRRRVANACFEFMARCRRRTVCGSTCAELRPAHPRREARRAYRVTMFTANGYLSCLCTDHGLGGRRTTGGSTCCVSWPADKHATVPMARSPAVTALVGVAPGRQGPARCRPRSIGIPEFPVLVEAGSPGSARAAGLRADAIAPAGCSRSGSTGGMPAGCAPCRVVS
jgi:hypothetical protein